MRYLKSVCCILLFLGVVCTANGQDTTSSPLSMYGLGETSIQAGGKYAGLGNAGLAFNQRGYVNTYNPACITRMDTTTFIMDVGMGFSYSSMRMNTERESAYAGNLNRISLAFRFFPHWYVALGMSPYSSTGYLITETAEVEGNPGSYVSSVYKGGGGLCKFYVNNAFAIGKKLSVGISTGLIAGTISQVETNGGGTYEMSSSKRAFYGQVGIDYRICKVLNVAAVYALSTAVSQHNNRYYSISTSSTSVEEHYVADSQYLPQTAGGGFTFYHNNWAFTGDYTWLQWSKNPSSISKVRYIDQHRANLGTVFLPKTKIGRRPMEIMGGLGYYNSYVQYAKGTMHNMSINAGVAVPVRESTLSVGLGWNKQINTKQNLLQEDRLMINVAVTFGEFIYRGRLQ